MKLACLPPSQTFLGVCHAFLPHEHLLNRVVKFLSHCSQIWAGADVQIIGEPIGAVKVQVLTSHWYMIKEFSSEQEYLGDKGWRFVYVSLCKGWTRCHLLIEVFWGWGNGGVVRCNWTKGRIFRRTLLFVVKPTSIQESKPRRWFFQWDRGAVSSTKACELTGVSSLL